MVGVPDDITVTRVEGVGDGADGHLTTSTIEVCADSSSGRVVRDQLAVVHQAHRDDDIA